MIPENTDKGKIMEYKIACGNLQATVDTHGAELVSLKKGDREYIWTADKSYWGRHAPVLFPFVGSLAGGAYTYGGKHYKMGQHGFARDCEFALEEISQEEAKMTFVLRNSEETYSVYPFHFELRIAYQLQEDTLAVTWRVTDTDEKPLHFSLGGHPGFLCPFTQDGHEYSVQLRKNGKVLPEIRVKYLEGSVVGTDEKRIALENGMLPLSHDLFVGDALILEQAQLSHAALCEDGTPYVGVSFEAPVAGIWSPAGKDAPFVCIEPWFGRADRSGFAGTLEEREYGNKLYHGASFEAGYSIEIY